MYLNEAVIEITDYCNFTCKHCDSDNNNSKNMTEEVFQKLLEIFKQKQVFRVIITGGEPLLHPNILEFARCISMNDISVVIQTNGYLLSPNIINKYKEINSLEFRISIYGMSKSHDLVTGKTGAFQKLQKTLMNLKKSSIRFKLRTPVTKWNYQDLPQLNCFINNNGYQLEYDFVITTGGNSALKANRLENDQFLKLFNQSKLARRNEKNLIPKRLIRCEAANTFLTFDIDGNVFPCGNLRISLGNVIKDSIQDIEKMVYLFNQTVKIPTTCDTCNLHNHCNMCMGISFHEQEDINALPEETCRVTHLLKMMGFY